MRFVQDAASFSIDGLDEVTTAQDRASVVASIANFVGSHQPRGNRFVCTSRISGYAAAPLPGDFSGARLLEMDDDSIERFLRLYVPAIERVEAAAKRRDIRAIEAERTIRAILDAFGKSPGVRRLAANPLLLTALLLVHRTHGALPERRVDAYEEVTKALGHTWRVHQGVPEAELPDERRLTQWLTRLADWMHERRPEGSATLRDLLEQWGPLWAALRREPWDSGVLGRADPADSDVGRAIVEFVEQVERHSGLLVERAPRRWGFPHLTFEEYYAGRALAFEGRAADRSRRIRQRLHDARYEEPILLALGLLGRNQPEELEAVFEAAVLATGEDAEQEGLCPSEYEDLLGRDFRFALRALADDIPAAPHIIDRLLAQAVEEALNATGRARFGIYRQALLERISALRLLRSGAGITQLLERRVDGDLAEDTARAQRFADVAARCTVTPVIATALRDIVIDGEPRVAVSAAMALQRAEALPYEAIRRLIDMIADSDEGSYRAAQVLGRVEALSENAVTRLVDLVGEEQRDVSSAARAALDGVGTLPDAAVTRLVEIIASGASTAFYNATRVLGGVRALPDAAVDGLVEIIADGGSPESMYHAAEVLGGVGALPDTAVARLGDTIVGSTAADTIVVSAAVAAFYAARVLGEVGALPDAAVARLLKIITDGDHDAAISAARVLGEMGRCPMWLSRGF